MSKIENNFLEYNLSNDAYVAFDALTLKSYIIDNLNESGQFTDQIYEGSNLSAIIDVIAYSYNVLMFYLNNTASESTFDQATLYENINKIVKFIGYKPTGAQTSLVSINGTAQNTLTIGNYTVQRYSYFLVDGIAYTCIKDYSFDKTTDEVESLDAINDNMIMHQGVLVEYPTYIAEGESFEILPIVNVNIVDSKDDRFIADNTIDVYVKEARDNTYYQYTEVDTLYLHSSTERVYEKRLNENGIFELKFGNDVFGRQLNVDDEVAVYYIKSDNEKGIISANAINGNKIFTCNNSRFQAIFEDVFPYVDETTLINIQNGSQVIFNNPLNSSIVSAAETVDEIKVNSPKIIASQLRLVSETDFETYILKNVPNIINDVKVLNNNSYVNEYLKYFYDMCVDPYKHNRVLLNQVNFADGCDFNNVNIFCVPTFKQTLDKSYPDFLSSSLKNLIIDTIADRKMLNVEIVPRDPVYMAYSIGFANDDIDLKVIDNTILQVVRENRNKINKLSIKSKVTSVITKFFDPANNELGQTMNLDVLSSELLSIKGVKSIKTINTKTNVSTPGISFLTWNPMYPDGDIDIMNQTTKLPPFKFPYLYNPDSMVNLISITDE